MYKFQKVFDESSNIVIPQKIHAVDKTDKCSECDTSFKPLLNLTEHENTHIGEEPFRCNQSMRVFSQLSNVCIH